MVLMRLCGSLGGVRMDGDDDRKTAAGHLSGGGNPGA